MGVFYQADQRGMLKSPLKYSLYAICIVFASLYSQSDLYQKIEESISLRALFYARERLSPERAFSSRVKMFAWDDDAYKRHGDFFSSNLADMQMLIRALCERNPRAIVIDKIFATNKVPDKLQSFMQSIPSGCKVVTVGGIVATNSKTEDTENPAAPPVNGTAQHKGIESFAIGKIDGFSGSNFELRHASEKLLPYLGGFGLAVKKKPGYFQAASSFAGSVYPHVGMHAADKIEAKGSDIFLNNQKTAFTVGDELFLNWYPKRTYLKKTYQIHKTIEVVKKGRPISIVDHGDLVMLFPHMWSGNADFHQSPFGEVFGGYAIATVADSVFNGVWLKTIDHQWVALLLAILLAWLVGFLSIGLSGVWVVVANVFGLTCIYILFAYFHQIVFFFQPMVAFNMLTALAILEKYRQKEKDNVMYHQALHGIISREDLNFVKNNANAIDLSPVEQNISIMFVDFVSFSTLAERTEPEDLFKNLHNSLNLLSVVVHKHGGIVDKTLGDGLLCYFGYDPIRRKVHEGHVDSAVNAAIEMQNLVVREWGKNLDHPQCLPIRVGINTGSAIIGNICDAQKIDLSIVGHNVNLAQRYESACEPFKIMVGPNSAKLLQNDLLNSRLQQRKISIKNFLGKYNAYELDPFEVDPFEGKEEHLLEALRGFRKMMCAERKQNRFLIDTDWVAKVLSPDTSGDGSVLNLSEGGMCIVFDVFFAANYLLDIELEFLPPGGKRPVFFQGSVKVRWGKPYKDKYLHGVEVVRSKGSSSWHAFVAQIVAS